MLQNIKELYGRSLAALDGDIGHVKDFYFDDKAWVIRYVVVDTGSWMTGRLVLLAPHAFASADHFGDVLQVKLLKRQIENGPSIAAHETVSRQFDEQYYRSYGWPVFWQGGRMWGMTGDPLLLSPQPADIAVRQAREPSGDRHLQSTKELTGYPVQAADGPIGHVADFRVNARSWSVNGLVVETGHWFSGRQILVSPGRIENISPAEKKVFVKQTKADIERTGAGDLATAGDETGGSAA
jgi:uncharacterized protein YrrD